MEDMVLVLRDLETLAKAQKEDTIYILSQGVTTYFRALVEEERKEN